MSRYAGRVTKMKGRSIETMENLRSAGRKFDVIYLDSVKERTGAFVFSALAWDMCTMGGYVFWDDMAWQRQRDPKDRSEPGVRLFAEVFKDCMDVRYSDPNSHQFIVRKVSEWPITPRASG